MPTRRTVRWRKSSYSPNSNCVELAEFPDDIVGIRNSNDPDALTFYLPRQAIGALIQGAKAGEFDDLI